MRKSAAAVLAGLISATSLATFSPTPTAAGPQEDAYAAVNRYRVQSGLAPVGSDNSLLPGVRAHSCWMASNDTITHGQTKGSAGYTIEGDLAGQRSNLIVSSRDLSPQEAVDLWMSGPYHAIGLLRPGLKAVAYDTCNDDDGRWRQGIALNIIDRLDGRTRVTTPITFPGNGATTHLSSFIAETPNPLDNCGYSTSGLPLLVMMPEMPAGVTASLVGPAGPVEVCTITPDNDITEGAALLKGDKAVIVVPAAPLANGSWTATVSTRARTVQWSFTVDTTFDPTSLPTNLPTNQPTVPPITQPPGFGACQAQAGAMFEIHALSKIVADRVMVSRQALLDGYATGWVEASVLDAARQNAFDWTWIEAQANARSRAIALRSWRNGTMYVRCGRRNVNVSHLDAFFLGVAKSETAGLVGWLKPYANELQELTTRFG